MTIPDPTSDAIALGIFLALLTGTALLLSRYVSGVFAGELSHGPPGRIEEWLFRLVRTDPLREEGWRGYARNMLVFNVVGFLFLFSLLLLQGFLPLNPQGYGAFAPHVALNTAVSFVTNTNWQVYAGETTASYLAQMAGLTVQNFLSAGTGICIALAVMRGITRRTTPLIGNFWVDITRCTLYILLPIAFVASLLLVSQGVVQNFDPYVHADGYGGPQTIAMGPVATQETIKNLGTNGGGFFSANAAHPYENPTALTNLLEIFLILLIPATLPFVFGRMAGTMRQGWAIYAAMLVIFVGALGALYAVELAGNPLVTDLGVAGVSMEGKEVRFGLGGTALFTTATTATSCGAVNAMFDSLTPLGGMVPLLLMLLGEVVFGGVGSGFYTFVGFMVLSVFVAGLMIGRTPEFLGKKIDVPEMRMAVVTVLAPGVLVVVLSAVSLLVPGALSAMLNPGPHGLSELVYAFASMSNNNGSAFGGLDGSSPYYAVAGSLAMAVGRFVPAVAMLALAGSMAQKKRVPPGPGTLPTSSATFVLWTVLVILIVGVLTFFPLFATGPIAEHLIMIEGGTT
ncbi:potassium-transporting ATPase subunit KdpA [uncultured Methanofollis sp.]|uniref:potassium-transporting ATPase subunit KdpA n=1 Tax=uncultured Methanofollis sp. TaxID=262500 RepID=UPI00260A55F9|nr:potassium-transporting ATPase subunit KdpA [uncultured Methanofollis sp.]